MSYTLSEFESKQLLDACGIRVPPEVLVDDAEQAICAAEQLGYPVVLKLCGRGIAHKSERDLVRLGLAKPSAVGAEAEDLLELRGPEEADAGLLRDPQFGPCVMLGLGGIFAEALDDVAFAVAPLEPWDAEDLIDALEHRRILGELRGEPGVDRKKLGSLLETLGRIGLERPEIRSIDLNPLVVSGAEPVIVDALVEIEGEPA
jgi:hypothetical protein